MSGIREIYLLSYDGPNDAVQTRISLVDDVVQQVPPSALTDTTVFDLVDAEISFAHCRIPTEILSEIFLFYSTNTCPQVLTPPSAPVPPATLLQNNSTRLEILRLDGSPLSLHRARLSSLTRRCAQSSPPLVLHSPPLGTQNHEWASRMLTQLDPVDVLAQHLFHIQDLDLDACSCTILPWVHILETAAPLLEVCCLRVDAHRPGMRHNAVVPLPRNFARHAPASAPPQRQ
jgi:hypothetical protein